MTALLTKIGLPVIIAALAFTGGMITDKKLTKAPVVKIPDCNCNCPEPKPCNGIDYDKIKSRNLTINNQQYLTVSGDSLFLQKMKDELKKEIKAVPMARCK